MANEFRRTARLALLGLILAAGAAPVAAQNAEKARANVAMCEGCHGVEGYRTAFPTVYHVPKIGGQQRAYLEAALKAYREGARPHPSMQGIAGGLTDEEIAELAAYYAGVEK